MSGRSWGWRAAPARRRAGVRSCSPRLRAALPIVAGLAETLPALGIEPRATLPDGHPMVGHRRGRAMAGPADRIARQPPRPPPAVPPVVAPAGGPPPPPA